MVSSHICVILHLSEFFQGFPAFFYCDSAVEKIGKIQIVSFCLKLVLVTK